MNLLLITLLSLSTLLVANGLTAHADEPVKKEETKRVEIVSSLDIAPVWAAHPVGFALLTHGPQQFVAFYDSERQLTVAARRLDEKSWQFVRLPVTTGWDSHNYIALAVDDDGHLHLSGDMHVVPLKYFRTTRPLDITSFERVPNMVGRNEERCTYPKFLRGPQNEFIFTYRDGSSGSGDQIFNVYEHATKTWRRLLDAPLTDGEGERNAYFDGPVRGPDGYFHLAWVWRETGDSATNHDLSYARSKDLLHWETGAGKPLPLPIKLKDCEIVDPVPVGGGIINGNTKIGFDLKGRVAISYHKNDAQAFTQPYNARLEDGRWKLYHITDWPYHWDFGGGTLVFEINLGPVRAEEGRLTQDYRHAKFGSGTWLLDPDTLRAVGQEKRPSTPPELGKLESTFAGMKVRWASDTGSSGEPGLRYTLRWETLDSNRDRPRTGPLPPPSMLRLYALKTVE
ncbi:MAG: BNR repeat-containing protein [Armatimonadota bacterium]|nr:BNR repeat-containing protein [Armatimonadota bacterium]